jgi:hypothetical protein
VNDFPITIKAATVYNLSEYLEAALRDPFDWLNLGFKVNYADHSGGQITIIDAKGNMQLVEIPKSVENYPVQIQEEHISNIEELGSYLVQVFWVYFDKDATAYEINKGKLTLIFIDELVNKQTIPLQ